MNAAGCEPALLCSALSVCLSCCRIPKARAEESGEYLCVFVFSSSPVANATIEVRGTAAVGIVPSLSLEMPFPVPGNAVPCL